MRRSIFIAAAAFLFVSTIAGAAEEPEKKTLSVIPELGYISLHEDTSDTFDDSLAFGIVLNYHLTRNIRAELPVLLSSHDGKDLPDGESADLSIVTATPGLNFGNSGKFRYWMFVGIGPGFVDSTVEAEGDKAETSEIGFATNMRVGMDVDVYKSMSVGVGIGVTAISAEFEDLGGDKNWEIVSYYTTCLRLGYTF